MPFISPRFAVADEPAFGFAGCGTFAEEMVVPSEAAVKIDDDVPYELLAGRRRFGAMTLLDEAGVTVTRFARFEVGA